MVRRSSSSRCCANVTADGKIKFARIVFTGAGVRGTLVLTPPFFLVDVTGHAYAPPANHPHFFYGFLSVAMAWQIAFLVIGSNPARFRPLMIPSLVEKLGFVVTVAVLHSQARISAEEATVAAPDLLLAVLFIAAFVMIDRTPLNYSSRSTSIGLTDAARRAGM